MLEILVLLRISLLQTLTKPIICYIMCITVCHRRWIHYMVFHLYMIYILTIVLFKHRLYFKILSIFPQVFIRQELFWSVLFQKIFMQHFCLIYIVNSISFFLIFSLDYSSVNATLKGWRGFSFHISLGAKTNSFLICVLVKA